MAELNQDRGVAADMLRQLMSGAGERGTEILKYLAGGGPLGGASRMAGTASVAPAEDVRTERTKTLMPNPLTEAQQKEIMKIGKEQVREAYEQGVPLTDMLSQIDTQDHSPYGTGTNPPTKSQMQGMGQTGTAQPGTAQPTSPKPNEGMNMLKALLKGALEGAAWGASPEMMKTKAALGAERDKSIQKFSMDMFMEDFKQDRMDNREQLKASLKSGEFEALRDPEIFISNLSNMVQAFDSVPLKGRGTSLLGSALAGTVGYGREERAQYDYWAEMLSYNIGGFVAGQTGRGLTENERELIKKAALPKLGGGSGAFIGKVQGILDSANSILSKEGKPTLPDARTLITSIRQGQNPIPEYTQQGGATQPGILDAIAAEKRRRGIQ
jgi:hypothetical protein